MKANHRGDMTVSSPENNYHHPLVHTFQAVVFQSRRSFPQLSCLVSVGDEEVVIVANFFGCERA